MEQLITTDQPGAYVQARMIEVAMLSKKIRLDLTRDQLLVISKTMNAWFSSVQLNDLFDKALFYLLFDLQERKLRKKLLSMKNSIRLSIDITHAWALTQLFQEIDLVAWPYENNVAQSIISEIDHQTV